VPSTQYVTTYLSRVGAAASVQRTSRSPWPVPTAFHLSGTPVLL